jgi:hypothetical protein
MSTSDRGTQRRRAPVTRNEGQRPVYPVFLRFLSMLVVWFTLGLMLGLLAGRGTGVVALAAALTAGTVIMTPLGLFFAALGGRWDDSLTGGITGMLLGVIPALLLSRPDPREAAALGLICGALLGTTAPMVFYHLPRAIMARLRQSIRGNPDLRTEPQ